MSTFTLDTTIESTPADFISTPASDVRLVLAQIGFEQLAFWRNRSRAFFSIAFPLVFLVVFNAINGNHTIEEMGDIAYATWFVPGILAYGLIMATFTNLATSIAVSRDAGVLKRIQGTPLPNWVYMAGCIGSTLITAVVLVAATLALGAFAYDVEVRIATLPALSVVIVLGSICFTILGLAATTIVPNADAAPAILNLLVLPLTFISGIWMVIEGAPAWLSTTAKLFPVRPLAHSLQVAFHPATQGSGFVGSDLVTLALWSVAGMVVCLKWFRWEAK